MLIKGVAKPRYMRIVIISAVCCALVFLGGRAVMNWYIKQQDEVFKVKMATMKEHANAVELSADRPRDYPLPDDLRKALNTPSDFNLHRGLADIPDSVRSAFAKAANEGELLMAERGGHWEATDVISASRLPRRRLSGVAMSGAFCLLFYEHGGIGKNDNVAAFRLFHDHADAVWHAYVAHNVDDPEALLEALQQKRVSEAGFF